MSALLVCFIRLVTGAQHVQVLVAPWEKDRNEEWFGGKCEQRFIEVEVEGRWFETKVRPCQRSS